MTKIWQIGSDKFNSKYSFEILRMSSRYDFYHFDIESNEPDDLPGNKFPEELGGFSRYGHKTDFRIRRKFFFGFHVY
jgi:hypothetical protein